MRATRGAIQDRGGATLRSHEFGGGGITHSRTRARAYARMSAPPGEREGAVNYERSVISMHQFD